ncbi:MAG: LacI family DNA-binding transcriptional regulator [Limnochordales bacterium]|nr:LacI family DNA-binding transcriptional regulator [Limnochordales bacterium]
MARRTIRDVAAEAGVSVATVSRVLNDKEGVGEKTRARVLAAAARLGFVPNDSARRLTSAQPDSFGFIVRYHRVRRNEDPFYSAVLYAASAELGRHGYQLVPLPVGEMEAEHLRRLVGSGRLGGFLLAGPEVPAELVREVAAQGLPLVLIDNRDPELPNTPVVAGDDQGGAAQAVQHLLTHGYRRFACLCGPLTWPSSRNRYFGYAGALALAGAEGGARVVSMPETTEASGYQALLRLLEEVRTTGEPMPQALFCANDAMALGALRAAKDQGFRIPQDLAIVGFDDVAMAAEATPPLTTVRVFTDRIGVAAARVLLGMVAGDVAAPPVAGQTVLVGTELVVRQSCGCTV